MSKKLNCFVVGILAFLIGIGVVSYFAFRPSYNLETSKNVCQKCLDVSKNENLETKTISEISNNIEFYSKKVRVKARMSHDAGYIFFDEEQKRIPVTFDRNGISCAETEKTLRVCLGIQNWYDGSVQEVTLVGYFGQINKDDNHFQSTEGFNIICVEKVDATEEELLAGKERFENNPFSLFNLLFD